MSPLWSLLALAITLIVLAWRLKIYPHRALIVLLLVPSFVSLWLIPLPDVWPIVVGIDLFVASVAIIDMLPLTRSSALSVQRQAGTIASLGKPHRVSLTVTNASLQARAVWIRDGLPDGLDADPDEFFLRIPGQSRSTASYTLRAHRRGAYTIRHVYVRLVSRWGMWQRMFPFDCKSRLNVYPDMKQLEEYALLARTNRLSLMGVRRTRRIGEDNEFERLRDYSRDDNYRHMDWRATARRRKLTVKDFQANQCQRVVFLVDCGRMMTAEAAGVSLLDHALNAMLMLSFVALRAGDQVGLLCFSNRIHTFVPPRGGRGQTNRLLHAAFDRYPELVESRYDEAFLRLATQVRKRALVVLVTNVIDEVNARQISRHLRALAARHLPLAVLLRDHALFDAVDQVAREPELVKSRTATEASERGTIDDTSSSDTYDVHVADRDFYTAAAAAEILTWRQRVLADLETSGVLLLDAFPENLAAPLVNRYLNIKARHLL